MSIGAIKVVSAVSSKSGDGGGGTTNPPTSTDFTMGIAGWTPGTPFATLYAQAKSNLGTPHAGIYFPPGSGLNWDSRCALIDSDAILAVTFKDWDTANIDSFCAAAAANHTGPVYVNWMNEVDVPSKNIDPTLYKQRIAYISSQTRLYSNTRSFTELTEYGIRDNNRVAPYITDVDVDCFGWSIFGNFKTMTGAQYVNNIVNWTHTYGGASMPFEVFGWGATPDVLGEADRAQWITDTADALRQANCVHALWYNTSGPAGDHTLDDSAALDAWAAEVQQNPNYPN